MQMQNFCEQMEKQLTTYEDSLARIEARLDAGGTEVKQQILPVVGDIKNLVTELTGWARAMYAWLNQGKEIFCFFDNYSPYISVMSLRN